MVLKYGLSILKNNNTSGFHDNNGLGGTVNLHTKGSEKKNTATIFI